ncbi:MAG TPA: nuclear transport factor 2 family protein [Methylomirabilota bacterium]|nr:nuclear transport factor 2 family protein [Methylomirabilota bacterium]
MERKSFERWLEKYGRAWSERNAQAAVDLYTEDGSYQVTPFVEAMQGHPAIFEYWSHVAETQRDIQFGYEILTVTAEIGVARWWGVVCDCSAGIADQAGRDFRHIS